MKRRMVWLVVSCLMVLALLVASCAKAETPATKEAAPVTKEAAPVAKEAAPVAKEAAPVAKEVVGGSISSKFTEYNYKYSPGADGSYNEKPRYGGALVLERSTNINNWDEAFLATWTTSWNLSPTNEALITGDWAKGMAGTGETDWCVTNGYVDPTLEVGNLATSWEFPDDQTIIFHIRPGVRWALDPNNAASKLVNGRELTADDVAFNIKRIFLDFKSSTMATTAGAARPVSVSATDKYTVVVKTPPGLYGMTWESFEQMRVMAPEIAAKYGDYQKWENTVGTGPFILKDFVSMSSATWVRNPSYWGKNPVGPGKGDQLPYLDSLKQVVIPDLATRMAALRTGKVDFDSSSYFTGDARQLIKTAAQLEYKGYADGYRCISARLDNPELPWAPQFDDKALKVRRALSMAINRPEMFQTLYDGEAEVLSYKVARMPMWEGAYTPLDQLPQDTREQFEFHPDKAKQLMVEAGFPDGFKTEIIVSGSAPDRIDEAQMLKQYWAKIGIDLSIKVVDNAVYTKYGADKTYQQMYSASSMASHAHTLMTTMTGAMWNRSIVSDPKIDDYYVKIQNVYFDKPKWLAQMKEMNQYVLSQVCSTTTGMPMSYKFWQPWLKNFGGAVSLGEMTSGAAFKYVWLDQELKESLGR